MKKALSIRYFIVLFIIGILIIIFMPTYETPYEKYNKLKYQGKAYLALKQYNKALDFFVKSSDIASKEFYRTDFKKYLRQISNINLFVSNLAYSTNYNIDDKQISTGSESTNLRMEIVEKINNINKLMFSKKMILEDFLNIAYILYIKKYYKLGEKYFIISYFIDSKNPYVFYLGALLEYNQNRKISYKLYEKATKIRLSTSIPMFKLYNYIIPEVKKVFEHE